MIEGKEVKLSCQIPCGLKPNKIMWKNKGEILPDTQITNNELIIRNIRIEDDNSYSCEVKDHRYRPSSAVELNVLCE